MRHAGILIVYSDHDGAEELSRHLAKRLQKDGHFVEQQAYDDAGVQVALRAVPHLVVTVGGDGTLLRTARYCPPETRLLGVNMGHLGYLAACHARTVEDACACIQRALQNEVQPQTRMRLRATWVSDGVCTERVVLNDVALDSARSCMITFEVRANGKFVTEYRSNGLVIATPTGSTAYNLAAGGPILMPGVQAIVLTAVCPHNLSNRPVVVDPGTVIDVRPTERSRTERAVLSFDGERMECVGDWSLRVEVGPSVQIYHDVDPFEVLRTRLHWS